MIDVVTTIALIVLGLAVLGAVIRMVLGPTLADRILALDVISTLAVGIIAVFAARTGYFLYLDIAIALALVAFLSTAAFARYLLAGDRR